MANKRCSLMVVLMTSSLAACGARTGLQDAAAFADQGAVDQQQPRDYQGSMRLLWYEGAQGKAGWNGSLAFSEQGSPSNSPTPIDARCGYSPNTSKGLGRAYSAGPVTLRDRLGRELHYGVDPITIDGHTFYYKPLDFDAATLAAEGALHLSAPGDVVPAFRIEALAVPRRQGQVRLETSYSLKGGMAISWSGLAPGVAVEVTIQEANVVGLRPYIVCRFGPQSAGAGRLPPIGSHLGPVKAVMIRVDGMAEERMGTSALSFALRRGFSMQIATAATNP